MIVDESSVCIDWATFNKSLVISIIGLMALYEPIRIYPIAYKHYTSEKIVLFQATISRERERKGKIVEKAICQTICNATVALRLHEFLVVYH